MYPTVAIQCLAHDVPAAASKAQCVILFPVGGAAEGDDFGPQQRDKRLKEVLRYNMFLALLSRASIYIVVTAAGTECIGE